jgi:hypothetical protein
LGSDRITVVLSVVAAIGHVVIFFLSLDASDNF